MFGASQEFSTGTLSNTGINVVELITEAGSQPTAIIVRPLYGTRYYSVVSIFLSVVMMLVVPAFMATVQGLAHMIPFVNIPMPRGMFSLGDFAGLYFLVSFIQGIRLWRRMFYPEREDCSEFEGPALFIFDYLPKSGSFYFVRVVYEPLAVLLVSIVLQDLYIIQSPLSLFLKFSAFCMAMRSFIAWFKGWEVERKIRDAKWAGQILSKIADGTATRSERDQYFVASIPKASVPYVASTANARTVRIEPQQNEG